MAVPSFAAGQFLAGIKRTLPRGKAWPRATGTVLDQVLSGLMPSSQRYSAACVAMLADVFPATAYSVLQEWEYTLGLPDPCAGELATIQQRRAQVVARFADSGGCSVDYFVNFAAQLGYTITITQFAPARFGIAKFGTPFYGKPWAFVWQVNVEATQTVNAQFGVNVFGDRYRSWNSAVLECELTARAPAHTTVIFNYVNGAPTGVWDQFFWNTGVWA